jgi:hypothetical protein
VSDEWKIEGYTRKISLTASDSYGKQTKDDYEDKLGKELLKTLYGLLILYLLLHWTIIPLTLNLARGDRWFISLHGWILVHVLCYIDLRRNHFLSHNSYALLLGGIPARCLWEMLSIQNLMSWNFLSFLVSALSEIIFLVILSSLFSKRNSSFLKKIHLSWFMLGLLLATGFFFLEKKFLKPDPFPNAHVVRQSFPIKSGTHTENFSVKWKLNEHGKIEGISSWKISQEQKISIDNQGFPKKIIQETNAKRVMVRNQTTKIWTFRLYYLHKTSQRLHWKFLRMFILRPKEIILLPLKDGYIHLLRSPEYRRLGFLAILPYSQDKFVSFYPAGEYVVEDQRFFFRNAKK